MIIAIDFDGTVVTHEFPRVGEDIGAVPVLRQLVKEGHQLVLNTMRSHAKIKANKTETANGKFKEYTGETLDVDGLQDAIDWFKSHNIPLAGVNSCPGQKTWTDSPKVYANLYIDDAALGVPLIYPSDTDPEGTRPYVDWTEVRQWLWRLGVLSSPYPSLC